MPVYLKPGELKVKDDGGNYSGLNIFAQESVQEVIESVQEVIDSIPPDYTELTGEVDDIKSDLNVTEIPDSTLTSTDFENGALDSNGLNAGTMNYRLRTINYIALPEDGDAYIDVTSDKDIYFTVWYYNTNDFATAKIGFENWRKSGKLNVPSGATYVRFCFSISKSTDQISASDITSLVVGHYNVGLLDEVVKVTSQTLTNEQKAQARENIGAMSDSDGWISNFEISGGYLCQKVEVV